MSTAIGSASSASSAQECVLSVRAVLQAFDASPCSGATTAQVQVERMRTLCELLALDDMDDVMVMCMVLCCV